MPYTKQTWVDGSGGGTPISAARLNYMETGIESAAAGSGSGGSTSVRIRNVMTDHGAVGNGTTNDTPAFQAAHDALPAAGGIIDIPPPPTKYRFATPLYISKPSVWLRGSGAGYTNTTPIGGACTISPDLGITGIFIGNTATAYKLSDFNIQGNAIVGTTTGDGIIVKVGRGIISNVKSFQNGRHGFHLNASAAADTLNPPGYTAVNDNCNLTTMLHCLAWGNRGDGFRLTSGGHGTNACLLLHPDSQSNGGWGIWNNGAMNKFVMPHVDGNTTGAYREEGVSSSWDWVYCEHNVTWNFSIANFAGGHNITCGGYGSPDFYYNGVLGTVGPLNFLNKTGVINSLQVGGGSLGDPTNALLVADVANNALRLGTTGNYFSRLAWYKSLNYGGNVTIPQLADGATHTFHIDIDLTSGTTLSTTRDIIMGVQLSATLGIHTTGVHVTAHISSSAIASRVTFVVTNRSGGTIFTGGLSSSWLFAVLQTS